MSINPAIPLSYNLADGKRRYILFCGAGISKDAGIPTGWEILLETLRLIRIQEEGENKSYTNTEMENYYETKYKDSTYAEILGSTFRSVEEQRSFLQKQFEGKTPGKSHRLIAEWVHQGLIRFIVTTNFDTLLEQALDDKGLRGKYSVITNDHDVLSSQPWNHVELCRIYKIHGTIDQGKIRNTEKDLISLDPDFQRDFSDLTERHGVIVLGYAGNKEDKNVMQTFGQRKFHGYTLYWAVHNTCNEDVENLVERQGGCFIKIDNASDFLEEVLNRVEIAKKGVEQNSKDVAQIRFKNILANPNPDAIIKQATDEEIREIIIYCKNILSEIDETDYNSLWESFIQIFNYSINLLILVDQIVKYKPNLFDHILPLFEFIQSLNENQSRSGKDGLISYLFYALFEMIGAILLYYKHFEGLNSLLKQRKLNRNKDELEYILNWPIQANFIVTKNETEAKESHNKWLVPEMHYLLQLIETQDIPFEYNIRENVIDVDLVYFIYTVIHPKNQYFPYWYPRSIYYLSHDKSKTLMMIKLDDNYGDKIARELFEIDYPSLIQILEKTKQVIRSDLKLLRNYTNPFDIF